MLMPTAPTTPLPLATASPTVVRSPTPIGPCTERLPGEGLLTVVTRQYAISRDYHPTDLVPLEDYLPVTVTLGYPTKVRRVIIEPLITMISAMTAEGLQPTILSGYRSYATQSIAWSKWLQLEPERAAIISAPPGFSEHQLGATLDFGSPELPDIVGQEGIQFHTYFYQTSEGVWLAAHAHEYGFTLSYPREAFDLTGFYYEPWHYRYVGVDLATRLKNQSITLTQFLLETEPQPCIP
jgi:D-alanyl-D-alanine carboxypeptidase